MLPPAAELPPSQELATDVGPLLFPATDTVMRPLIAASGDWEIDEAQLFRAQLRSGMRVIDVGAHVGYYTLLASRAVGWRGRVVAVEPQPATAALLRANVARNRRRNVRVIEAAAWSEPTRVSLRADVEGVGNSADNRVVPGTSGGTLVEAVRLDDLVERADVVKLDAQGTDHVALAGMQELLRRCRPVVFVELWPHGIRAFGDDPTAVVGFYRSLGFRLSMPGVQSDFDGWTPGRFAEVAESLPGGFGTLVLRPL